jgi:hypothetical protein
VPPHPPLSRLGQQPIAKCLHVGALHGARRIDRVIGEAGRQAELERPHQPLGLSREKIEALDDYAESPLFSDAEKLALEYADALTDTARDCRRRAVRAPPTAL